MSTSSRVKTSKSLDISILEPLPSGPVPHPRGKESSATPLWNRRTHKAASLCLTWQSGLVISHQSSAPFQFQTQKNKNGTQNIKTHRIREEKLELSWSSENTQNKSTKKKKRIKFSSHLDLSFSGRGNAELFPLFLWHFVSLKELKLVANFRRFHLYVLNKITRPYNICRRLAQKNCLEMSHKDDNSFDSIHTTANAVLCETEHRLHPGFLLSKYHAAAWYMCNSNFDFAHKQSKAFSVPIIMASTNSEQHYVHMSYIQFHPNWAIHIGSTRTDSFMLFCMELNHLINFCGCLFYWILSNLDKKCRQYMHSFILSSNVQLSPHWFLQNL